MSGPLSSLPAFTDLAGTMVVGSVTAVYGVDADGIGTDPTYDVTLFPKGQAPVRLEGVAPTFARWWKDAGLDTKAPIGGTDCWATFIGSRLALWIPEGPAVFEQDCEDTP
jgi:hypothetical protein